MGFKLNGVTIICLLLVNQQLRVIEGASFPCKEEGSFADPEDCQKYHVCAYNEAGDLMESEFICPGEDFWCESSLKCEDPLVCPCEGITGQSTQPTEVTTEPTEVTTEPTEVTTEPTEVTTEPTEVTTEPTEVTTPPTTSTESSGLDFPRDCLEIQENVGNPIELNSSFPYEIYPFGPDEVLVRVRCDFDTDGGGWTIIQTRDSGPREEFLQDWDFYENGFGSALANYWIGLKVIHELTSTIPQTLRVDLNDWDGNSRYAKYEFSVSDASDNYRLSVSEYEGDAGDSLTRENNSQFTTRDRDNDESPLSNCAQTYNGAWWFRSCFLAHLNGLFLERDEAVNYGQGLQWFNFTGYYYSLKSVSMKIRTASWMTQAI